MTKNNGIDLVPADTELRRQAEVRVRGKVRDGYTPRSDAETQRLLHELEVHKIELEIQNAELLQARNDMEKILEKYTDLYDFAPIGYITLDCNGDISAVNLCGASLLGGERSKLIGRSFGLFIPVNSRSFFSDFLGRVLICQIKESCEVVLLNKGRQPITIQVEAMATASGQEFRLALIDISERKKLENHLIQTKQMETSHEQKV